MFELPSAGKTLRLGRLFDRGSGRTVIVAIDHGIGGAPEGLAELRPAMEKMLAGEPDGLILTPGALRSLAPLLAGRRCPGLLVAADYSGGATVPGGSSRGEEYRLLVGIEDALRLGAEGLKVLLVFGRESLQVHAENVATVASLARAAESWGVPLLVEPVLWGRATTDEQRRDPRVLRHICRIAVELGADIVKAPMPADEAMLTEIARASPVPVVILGGPRMESTDAVLDSARRAVQAGAAGVAFGRNVFQHPDPAAMIRALREAVHGER